MFGANISNQQAGERALIPTSTANHQVSAWRRRQCFLAITPLIQTQAKGAAGACWTQPPLCPRAEPQYRQVRLLLPSACSHGAALLASGVLECK